MPLGAAMVLAAMLGSQVARADGPVPNGPGADFPVVTGEPYAVGTVSYTPANAMNYDAVGYASIGADGAAGVSAAHHTLPLPSYVEVTSLDSGKTILVRVDQRGPMQATNLIELSPAAAAQLGLTGGSAGVRVRRVNPPEAERAILRGGAAAPERMTTPKALLAVLARKLPGDGTVQLSPGVPLEKRMASVAGAPAAGPKPKARPFKSVAASPARSVGADFLAPPAKAVAMPRPVKPASAALAMADPAPAPTMTKPGAGTMVVQAGAYAVKANAQAVAGKLGARLDAAGAVWRVRMGPFVNIADAEAALAKARAAGYTARIQRAE